MDGHTITDEAYSSITLASIFFPWIHKLFRALERESNRDTKSANVGVQPSIRLLNRKKESRAFYYLSGPMNVFLKLRLS